jgi:acyl-coenzyme A synthetase/AMP-(fatty) acid ligase
MVADCAVIGVYDPEQATELPRGYIVLQSGVPKNESTANEIKKFVAEQVVHYKQLRSIVFIDEIPKSASGKILRRILRDAAEKEQQEKTQRSKL